MVENDYESLYHKCMEMLTGPVESGNILLIIMGAALLISGPYITYRTVKSIKDGNKQHFSNFLNFLIAVLFSAAGYLFMVNNFRGNPLA